MKECFERQWEEQAGVEQEGQEEEGEEGEEHRKHSSDMAEHWL